MINEKFNQPIMDMWKEHFNGQSVRAPSFFNEFKKDVDILFIGANPSFSKKGYEKFLKGTQYEAIGKSQANLDRFFMLRFDKPIDENFPIQVGNVDVLDLDNYVRHCVEIEKLARDPQKGYKTYFGPFNRIAEEHKKETGKELIWEYMDLFYYRTTKLQRKSYKKTEPRDKDNLKYQICDEKEKLNRFGDAQVDLSVSIIEKIEPKVILVASAFASKKLMEKLEFQKDAPLNKNLGTSVMQVRGKETPIFFSSTLSQGRLDNGSFKRLRWHITFVLSNLRARE
jgi:hypothetical protein